MDDYTSPIIKIPLTKGYVAIVDAQDSDLAEYNWQALVSKRAGIYAARQFEKGVYTHMHTIILERKIGRPLQNGELCDHENGIKTDNRRSNLRIANHTQNAQNKGMRSDNTSGYKGVYFHKQTKRWRAHITINKKHISLGGYSTAEAAHKAYSEAAQKYFGEFARENQTSRWHYFKSLQGYLLAACFASSVLDENPHFIEIDRIEYDHLCKEFES